MRVITRIVITEPAVSHICPAGVDAGAGGAELVEPTWRVGIGCLIVAPSADIRGKERSMLMLCASLPAVLPATCQGKCKYCEGAQRVVGAVTHRIAVGDLQGLAHSVDEIKITGVIGCFSFTVGLLIGGWSEVITRS